MIVDGTNITGWTVEQVRRRAEGSRRSANRCAQAAWSIRSTPEHNRQLGLDAMHAETQARAWEAALRSLSQPVAA